MNLFNNDQLKLAFEYVQNTNINIFLTGKAGTGKTTFLHNLRKNTHKRSVVVAPTGVAAINAGGVTIHSFFQLNFAPNIPEQLAKRQNNSDTQTFVRKLNREKIRIIKCLDLLIIDEISMVRADILDSIDEVLRIYRNPYKPFGGVQLLMIGDLHQLSPVIKDEEWNILKKYYRSIYFFESFALQKTQPICIELTEIFRQSDDAFITLLNHVRENNLTSTTINELNARFIAGFKPNEDEGYITLTTHNNSAQNANNKKLQELKTNSFFFNAEIIDDFPIQIYPTEEKLELKIGAQVMFIKNDISNEKRYFNGKIGKITKIIDDKIYVKCPSDNDEIIVGKTIWENIKYTINEDTKEINEEVIGKFVQFPLKLAWAITIHKSQGLTFEKVIIDAQEAFAFGQVYVALSRCRTLEGLVLSSLISPSGIKVDNVVLNFSKDIKEQKLTQQTLDKSKKQYQQELITEMYDFKLAKNKFNQVNKIAIENKHIFGEIIVKDLFETYNCFEKEIYEIAEKFKTQLNKYFLQELIPENNHELQERIAKANKYFLENLENKINNILKNTTFETDNKNLKKIISENFEKLQFELFIKTSCIKESINCFNALNYIKSRSTADIDFKPKSNEKNISTSKVPKNIKHPELYLALKNWRNALSEQLDVPSYLVLPYKSLIEIVEKIPTNFAALKNIKGIGNAKIKQFGEDILSIIESNFPDKTIEKKQSDRANSQKKNKGDSKKMSFELYKSGKTIEEIAQERSLTVGTIEGHLALCVGDGLLPISDFVTKEKLKMVDELIEEKNNLTWSKLKTHFTNEMTDSDIKFILQYLKQLNL